MPRPKVDFLAHSQILFLSFPAECPSRRRSLICSPAHHRGVPTAPATPPLLRPPAEGRSVRARPRSRPGSVSGARLCGWCRHVVVVVRRRWRRRSRSTLQRPRRCPRRSSGWAPRGVAEAVPRRASPCSAAPVRKPTPTPRPVYSGVRVSRRRGRPSRRRGCHPEEAATRGGWGRRAWPEEGGLDGGPRPPEGGTGSGSAAAGPGPGPSACRGGGVRPGRLFRTRWGRAHGDEGCEALPVASGEMPADFQEGERAAPTLTGPVGVLWWREGRRLGAAEPRGERSGPDLWEGGVAARLWSRGVPLSW